MGKFAGPSVIPGAQVELPTGPGTGGDFADFTFEDAQAPSQVPTNIPTAPAPEAAQASPVDDTDAFWQEMFESGLGDALQEADEDTVESIYQSWSANRKKSQQQPAHQVPAESVEGVDLDQAALVQEQRARERVPALSEKLGGTFTELVDDTDNPLGAALDRGSKVTQFMDYSAGGPSLVAQPTAAKRELISQGHVEAGFASEGGVKALRDSEASITPAQVLFDPRVLDAMAPRQDGTFGIDPEFGSVMTLATEAFLFQESQGQGARPEDNLTPEQDVQGVETTEFTKAKGNQGLGREIYRQWMRQKAARDGRPTDEYVQNEGQIEPATFTFIGDMAKEVYSEANPDMLARIPADADGQVAFQLTPKALRKLDILENTYKGLLGQQEVAPLNAVSETAQPIYEAKGRVRQVTTKVGDLGDWSQVQEAMRNYHGVKYVNDPQREKMAMGFAILGLLDHGQNSFYANMFDIGAAKVESVQGQKTKMISEAERMQHKDPIAGAELMKKAQNYNVEDIVARDRGKFLSILGGLAKYSGKANHLTFSMQGLTGRTHVQQTVYNPQAHKVTRFVVGSGNTFTWKPGEGALDRDFREIMATHFVDGGKDLTTEERLKQFEVAYKSGALNGYIQMGQEIAQNISGFDTVAMKTAFTALANAKNAQEAAQVKQEIAANAPARLSDNVIKHIGTKTNDETLYELEALVELAKYDDAIKNNKQMSSTINVEMDGKTHGPATNGAQLGIKGMAERTGLIRTQDYTLTDTIDSRKAMGEWMNDVVESYAGELFPAEKSTAFVELLAAAVKDRTNFLKKSPMTMGYGQELGSLRMHVDTTIFNGEQSSTIRDIMRKNNISDKEAGDFLHTMLVNSIYQIFDRKVVDSARLLRANNFVATLTNETLWMENAMGFKSYAAAKQNQKGQEDSIDYYFTDESGKRGKRSAKIYKEKAEGSAVRKYDADGVPVPGGYGHGRVIPIAVQSYDGNMISKTGSGQSWDRIKKTSAARGGKNAFVLPIFDAFKTDLGSFSAVREEANRNWVDGLRNHSYIESIMDKWWKEATGNFKKRMDALPQDQFLEMNMDNEWRGLFWAFNVDVQAGPDADPQVALQYMIKKIMAAEPKAPEITVQQYQKQIGRAASKLTEKIMSKMEASGIPTRFDGLTVAQARATIRIINDVLQIGSRNSAMVSQIKRDKSKLFDEVTRNRREARQVDIA